MSVFYERVYGGPQQRWVPYWSAALAVGSPDADPVTGPEVGGGTFDTGKVDNYTHYGVQLGLVYRFGG